MKATILLETQAPLTPGYQPEFFPMNIEWSVKTDDGLNVDEPSWRHPLEGEMEWDRSIEVGSVTPSVGSNCSTTRSTRRSCV